MSTLAIVIPAYKSIYFKRTLQSLNLQTCKDFTVYVGNDSGDIEIESIVESFKDQLDIHYTYFDNNIGSRSLVKQWERCLALTRNEEWIWILPDDDYADFNCVELFYLNLHKFDFDIFRFNVKFVNAVEKIFKQNPSLETFQNSYDSLLEKLSFKRGSTVAEFIFRKATFKQFGFVDIPMAWGSDDLIWFLMGIPKGITGTNEAYVYLRQSEFNISNNYNSLASKKINANFIFFEYLFKESFFIEIISSKGEKDKFNRIALNFIMYNLQDFSLKLGLFKILKFAIKGNRIWGGGILKNIRRFYLNNKRI